MQGVSPTLSRKMVELEESFKMLDIDASGSIDIDELSVIMRCLGRKPSDNELLELTGVDSEGEPLELGE